MTHLLLTLALLAPLSAQYSIIKHERTGCGWAARDEMLPRRPWLERTHTGDRWLQFSLHYPDRFAVVVIGVPPLLDPPWPIDFLCQLYVRPIQVLAVPSEHVTWGHNRFDHTRLRFHVPGPVTGSPFLIQIVAGPPGPTVASLALEIVL